MAKFLASMAALWLLVAPPAASAQAAVQLEYWIGINCVLPARASISVDVPIGVPVTVIGNACGTTPITGAAQLTFRSSDPAAVLPLSFRFLPGARVAIGQVTFNSPGPQTLVVEDVGNAIVGVSFEQANVVLPSGALALFVGYGCPLAPMAVSTVTVGTPVTILGFECPAVPIQSINLTFSSSDPRALLPPPLVFPGGHGRVLGTVTFRTPGLQSIVAADNAVGISAVAAINVLALPTSVPVDAGWALLALAAGLSGFGALRLRLRRLR